MNVHTHVAGSNAVALVDRAKNICLTPVTEWAVIAGEPAVPGALITGYVLPLAAIGAVAKFIGGSIVGSTVPYFGTYRMSLMSGLVLAVFTLCMSVVGVFVLSIVINALAPTFGGQKNSIQALKVAVYSYTPMWIAGVLYILPALSILAVFGAFYAMYLLYLGLPRLMQSPADKAIPYTAVVIICAIVLSIVILSVGALFAGAGLAGAGAFSGASAAPASDGAVRQF